MDHCIDDQGTHVCHRARQDARNDGEEPEQNAQRRVGGPYQQKSATAVREHAQHAALKLRAVGHRSRNVGRGGQRDATGPRRIPAPP